MTDKKLATVDCLPGRNWNAHAALGDAMQRAPIQAPLVVFWLDENNQLCHACSATNQEAVWLCSAAIAGTLHGQ